jgi:hypothetical protein
VNESDQALVALKDLESFCENRIASFGYTSEKAYGYRDILFLIRQHIHMVKNDVLYPCIHYKEYTTLFDISKYDFCPYCGLNLKKLRERGCQSQYSPP